MTIIRLRCNTCLLVPSIKGRYRCSLPLYSMCKMQQRGSTSSQLSSWTNRPYPSKSRNTNCLQLLAHTSPLFLTKCKKQLTTKSKESQSWRSTTKVRTTINSQKSASIRSKLLRMWATISTTNSKSCVTSTLQKRGHLSLLRDLLKWAHPTLS